MSASENHIAFWVSGKPAPQGSKKHVGGGRLVEVSKYLKPWREAIMKAAKAAQGDGWTALDGPLMLVCEFWIERPASHPKRTRTYPTTPPDLDKLIRAVGDALTQSGTIHDDSRIIATLDIERYVPTDERHALPDDAATSGVLITVQKFSVEADRSWAQKVSDFLRQPSATSVAEGLPSTPAA